MIMAPVDSTPVATMLLSEQHSPLRSLEMKPSAIEHEATNADASSGELNALSSFEAETLKAAGAAGIANEPPSSHDLQAGGATQKLPLPVQNEGNKVEYTSLPEQPARGGTFVTPKRLKINHVAPPSKNSSLKVEGQAFASASASGNAVTPASIRGVGTPGTVATSSPESTDGKPGGNSGDHAGGAKDDGACDTATSVFAVHENVRETYEHGSGVAGKMEPPMDVPHLQMTSDETSKTVNLGPRMNVRQSSPPKAIALMPRKQSATSNSPVVPRRLDSSMANGTAGQVEGVDVSSSVAAAGGSGAEAPSPALEDIPPPSHFLAAKISPLRSSSRLKKSETKFKGRDLTPPPPSSGGLEPSKTPKRDLPDIADAKIMSPCGFFLSPRTPKPNSHGQGDCPKSSASACLTPSNFASDFGRGHKKEPSFDASDVFSWLKSPTGQGLFSPNGGLTALSVTNTPRGMYGFFGANGSASAAAPASSGKTSHTPSTHLAPSGNSNSLFFSDVDGLVNKGEEIVSPKTQENRSMICISPLASQRGNAAKKAAAAPESPIDFNQVFASPRYPTPRLSRSAKKDGNPSPVASALHTAERDILEDADLNDLLQLAGTTTPGGRPIGLLSPILTNSFRRIAPKSQQGEEGPPPESLQLPMISGRSTHNEPKSTLARKGDYSNPPQLSLRGENSRPSSKGSRSKKRKSPEPDPSHPEGAPIPANGHHPHHHHGMGYPHPSMLHYRPHPPARHGSGSYYHQPSHHHHAHHAHHHTHHAHHHASYPPPHPAPQHHYAYSDKHNQSSSYQPNKPGRLTKRQAAKQANSKGSARPPPEPAPLKKKTKKAPPKKSKGGNNSGLDPHEQERVAAAIRAVNESSGGGNEKAAALAAAILRGVTMRPSGKWQAQLYYAGKSRYIGVFDSREKAALAYEIAREVLKTEKGCEPSSAEETDKNVTLARKAAFAGVNESGSASK